MKFRAVVKIAGLFSSDGLKEAEHTPLNAPEQAPDYLAILTHPGVPPRRLDLKENCIQRNMISVENGLVRNARVRVIIALHPSRRFVEVQLELLLNAFESHCIPRIDFAFHPNRSSWTVNRRQFPLRPAYATTFNGCQGLTLALLDFRTDPSAHGQ
ncbi:hypothetical protein DFJ58DRAFT_701694 [Suillus subalutaceus]|uniref:uncharacterized protein n=1 Tax=Suillus subalutaceus TaxID=48586 RepID=UPI001B86701F|nr:uncharacterized protein DFJ58DRAFT_701694 [Suillus subalutaceus]KAG1858989.1 hypothetical protein DFJ58DRAFT_701694 [Suillus subalutaceus]